MKKENIIVIVPAAIIGAVLVFLAYDLIVPQQKLDLIQPQTETQRTISEQEAAERALAHVSSMEGLAQKTNPQILSSRYGLNGCPECYEIIVRVGEGDYLTDVIVEINGEQISSWITK